MAKDTSKSIPLNLTLNLCLISFLLDFDVKMSWKTDWMDTSGGGEATEAGAPPTSYFGKSSEGPESAGGVMQKPAGRTLTTWWKCSSWLPVDL